MSPQTLKAYDEILTPKEVMLDVRPKGGEEVMRVASWWEE